MNKRFVRKLVFIPLVLLFGCFKPNVNAYDYSLYESYKGSLKGVEIYCWKDSDIWYSGILPGTNRIKFAEEVNYLQNNLPCPLGKMKEILSGYAKREIGLICITTKPVEILDYLITEENIDEYRYVCEQLGIGFPEGQFSYDGGDEIIGESRNLIITLNKVSKPAIYGCSSMIPDTFSLPVIETASDSSGRV